MLNKYQSTLYDKHLVLKLYSKYGMNMPEIARLQVKGVAGITKARVQQLIANEPNKNHLREIHLRNRKHFLKKSLECYVTHIAKSDHDIVMINKKDE